MKYYVIAINTLTDDTTEPAIYTFDSIDKAESKFHQQLYSAINGTTTNKSIVQVMADDGVVHFKRVWERETTSSTETN